MSTNPNNPTPFQAPGAYPPPKKGRSVWMGLGIGCAVLLLICCGGFAGVSWWGKKKFDAAKTTDPVKIGEIAEQIAEVPGLPSEFRPKFGLKDYQVPLLGYTVNGVAYAPEKDDGLFIMGEVDSKMSDEDREKLVQFMRGMTTSGGNSSDPDVEIIQSKTIETTVRGKPATFKLQEAMNRKSKDKAWQVSGTFEGRGGPAMLLLVLPYDRFREDQIKKIVEGIK